MRDVPVVNEGPPLPVNPALNLGAAVDNFFVEEDLGAADQLRRAVSHAIENIDPPQSALAVVVDAIAEAWSGLGDPYPVPDAVRLVLAEYDRLVRDVDGAELIDEGDGAA